MHALRPLILALVATAAFAVPGSALAAPPPNDDFHNAVALVTRATVVQGTNVEATKQTDEDDHAANAGGHSIWYSWTTPVAGKATVSTCGSDFDTLLGVYTGTDVAALDELVSNDNACDNQSIVTFDAVAGGIYRIAVDGKDGATGGVWLSLRVAPPNDDFANAQELAGDSGSVAGTTEGSWFEDDEPSHAGDGWNSVWYEWTAPSSGWATFETCGIGTPFDTVLGVYTGESLGALTTVAGNDDACGMASRVAFQASAGTVYRIAVAGYEGETGDFTLTWNRNAPPPMPLSSPTIAGLVRDGETVTASEGTWSGEPPFTYSYQWGRCDRFGDDCAAIADATSRTFTVRSIDVGYRLYVRVTASNASGSGSAFSDITGVVVGRAPSNTTPPSISGPARPGGMLVASGGAWAGTAPLSLSYQWQSCGVDGNGCTDLAGQTGQVMQVPNSAVGNRLRVVVTATNSLGSALAPSQPTAMIRRLQQRRCVVPNVKGKALRTARAAITRGQCRVGRITRAFSRRVKAGRVVAQTPRAGARRAVGTRVNLVVSKGKRR